jgi:small subunit ribosomal protein S6
MRRYETIVIVDPDLGDDDRTSLFNRIKEIIPQQQGVFINEDLWGTKKLAYEIKKRPRGYYARFDYCGMGPVVDEIERFFRIDDRVLKYLTVQLADEADPEAILAEMSAAEPADKTATADAESAPNPGATSPAPEASTAAKQAPAPEASTATEQAPAPETTTKAVETTTEETNEKE